MSFLIASPEALAATATYLTGIGSAINAANAVAAAPTTEILAAGTDEVSTAISALFGAHAQAYQRSAPTWRHFTTSSCIP